MTVSNDSKSSGSMGAEIHPHDSSPEKIALRKKYIRRRRMLVAMLFALVLIVVIIGIVSVFSLGDKKKISSENIYADDSGTAYEPVPPPATDDIVPEPVTDLDGWNLIMVSPREPLPDGFSVQIQDITNRHAVDARIARAVKMMFAAAASDGIGLTLMLAYRSAEEQQELFDEHVKSLVAAGKTQEEAEQSYVRPGYSEHQTGLSIDVVSSTCESLSEEFENTPAFTWLLQNAHKFGFILRYPKEKQEFTMMQYEPWHYRYVGEEAALEIYRGGLCLEEYLYLKQPKAGIDLQAILDEELAAAGIEP